MYINGKKITLEELQELADKLIGSLIDDLFESIDKDGLAAAIPGDRDKQISVLKKMMKYYIEREQYEKCAAIRDLININNALQN
tara:strand:- start:667 stop:918 length:252 start_codon:yes stop_codon:yes gene_type:complete